MIGWRLTEKTKTLGSLSCSTFLSNLLAVEVNPDGMCGCFQAGCLDRAVAFSSLMPGAWRAGCVLFSSAAFLVLQSYLLLQKTESSIALRTQGWFLVPIVLLRGMCPDTGDCNQNGRVIEGSQPTISIDCAPAAVWNKCCCSAHDCKRKSNDWLMVQGAHLEDPLEALVSVLSLCLVQPPSSCSPVLCSGADAVSFLNKKHFRSHSGE